MKLFIFVLMMTSSVMVFAEETSTDCMAMSEEREKNVKAQAESSEGPSGNTVTGQ